MLIPSCNTPFAVSISKQNQHQKCVFFLKDTTRGYPKEIAQGDNPHGNVLSHIDVSDYVWEIACVFLF